MAVALLVAGCSGDEPGAQPPKPRAPSTSPVTTTSPEPTPPALPPAARRNSKAGAVAFAHHYIDLINFASESGQVDDLRRSSSARCGACADIARFISTVYSRGGDIRGGHWAARAFSVLPNGPDRWLVVIDIHADPQVFRPKAGAQAISRTGGNYKVSLFPSWVRRSWVIQRLTSTQ